MQVLTKTTVLVSSACLTMPMSLRSSKKRSLTGDDGVAENYNESSEQGEAGAAPKKRERKQLSSTESNPLGRPRRTCKSTFRTQRVAGKDEATERSTVNHIDDRPKKVRDKKRKERNDTNEMITVKYNKKEKKEPVGYPLSRHGDDEREEAVAESRDEARDQAEVSGRLTNPSNEIDDSARDDRQVTITLETIGVSSVVGKEPTVHEDDKLFNATLPSKRDATIDSDSEDARAGRFDRRRPSRSTSRRNMRPSRSTARGNKEAIGRTKVLEATTAF